MSKRRIPEAWAIIGVSLLMVLALALLARGLVKNKDRAGQLGELAVSRAMDSQNVLLDMLVKTYTWDIQEEAAYIANDDSTGKEELLSRWLPVLRSRFAINSIGLADDRGNDHLLEHADSLWRYTVTIRDTVPFHCSVLRWSMRATPETGDTLHPDSGADPRQAPWYSQALEDRRDGPVWTVGTDTSKRILHLSLLLRGGQGAPGYRVIHFDMDADAMFAGSSQWAAEVSSVLLTSKGAPLTVLDTSEIGRAWTKALAGWKPLESSGDIKVTVGDHAFVARLSPYDLNGVRLFTGVMVGFGPIEQWNEEGRTALWWVLGLLVLLGLLLATVYLQSRNAEKRVQRQTRRSTIQARNLAQAIDERETLDREVHHRVKNNLQVVSSLLNLQAQRVPLAEAQKEFLRGKRRIDSMALVHHKLYRQKDLAHVDLGVFLNDLATALAAMFDPDSRGVSHSVDSGGVKMDADTSIQLGMITCELLANCHQHAFPYSTGGHIDLIVRDTGEGMFTMTVKDNGKGTTPAATNRAALGLEVVEALAEQLDGKMRMVEGEGTTVEVTFRSIGH
ncbi:MAG: sensor histidine kinase [Flavobacteriales bacterium]|nr:sensor histidine kinase [Flavobacteriales bacterium]